MLMVTGRDNYIFTLLYCPPVIHFLASPLTFVLIDVVKFFSVRARSMALSSLHPPINLLRYILSPVNIGTASSTSRNETT